MTNGAKVREDLLRRELISTQRALATCEAELQNQRATCAALEARCTALSEDLARKADELSTVYRSRSWRLTGFGRALAIRGRQFLKSGPPPAVSGHSAAAFSSRADLAPGNLEDFRGLPETSKRAFPAERVLLQCSTFGTGGIASDTLTRMRLFKSLAADLGFRTQLILLAREGSLGEPSAADLAVLAAREGFDLTVFGFEGIDQVFRSAQQNIQAFVAMDSHAAVATVPRLRLQHPELRVVFSFRNEDEREDVRLSSSDILASRAADVTVVQTQRERARLLAIAPDAVVHILPGSDTSEPSQQGRETLRAAARRVFDG
jgi:hypothetical protein